VKDRNCNGRLEHVKVTCRSIFLSEILLAVRYDYV